MQNKKMLEFKNYFLNKEHCRRLDKLEIENFIQQDITDIGNDGYILRLDIDNLRGINATRGNQHGDSLINCTYNCILNVLNDEQKAYCLNGGEFVIISHNNYPFQKLYRAIQKKINDVIIHNSYRFSFSICGGVYLLDETLPFSELLRRSEFTLAYAKTQDHGKCYQFRINDYHEKVTNHHLKILLQKSVNEDFDGFRVYFQPVVNQNEKVVAAEALLRYQNDDVIINPGLLISLLEETGLMIPVGRWILQQALAFCYKIRQYNPAFIISVNMSYIEANDYNRLEYILAMLEKYNVPAQNLGIELTESGLLETDKNIQRLWRGLKEAGVYISLDDFGTGFSNFHYIEDIQPDLLKVDYIITREAMLSERHFMILEAINRVVNFLDLKICIEGIEDEVAFEKMKQLNATFYQGYHFSKPCPAEEFIANFFNDSNKEESD